MIILGNVVEVKDESGLSITWYHRVPIGLEKNTTVYLVLIPRAVPQTPHNLAEVILTPINPESWGDLWKIKCKFHERPGVVAKLLEILREKQINILFQESATLQQDRLHFVSIIADLRLYDEGGLNTWKRINDTDLDSFNYLAELIALETLEDVFMENSKPAVSVTRMKNFYDAYFPYRQSNLGFNPTVLSVKNFGEIRIEQPLLIENIKKQLWNSANTLVNNHEETRLKQAILNTHTEDRYISLLFPDPNTTIVVFKIVHEERIGALAIISKVIKELGLNILSSFNRLQKMATEAHWNIILDIGNRNPKEVSRQILDLTKNIDSQLILDIEQRPIFEFGKSFVV